MNYSYQDVAKQNIYNLEQLEASRANEAQLGAIRHNWVQLGATRSNLAQLGANQHKSAQLDANWQYLSQECVFYAGLELGI